MRQTRESKRDIKPRHLERPVDLPPDCNTGTRPAIPTPPRTDTGEAIKLTCCKAYVIGQAKLVVFQLVHRVVGSKSRQAHFIVGNTIIFTSPNGWLLLDNHAQDRLERLSAGATLRELRLEMCLEHRTSTRQKSRQRWCGMPASLAANPWMLTGCSRVSSKPWVEDETP